jgi:hypothetical protein
MRRIALLIAAFVATSLLQLYSAPAYAVTFTRTWVSHNGSDGNPCSQTLPCQTLGAALSSTSAGGEVDCLDSGDFSSAATTITMSVTIDCHGMVAAVFNSSTGDGIAINAPGSIVTLRGLTLNAMNTAGAGTNTGVRILAAATVHIEDCAITEFKKGIADLRTTGLTKLFVKNTVVRSNNVNSNATGIVLAAAPKNSVVIENVQMLDNDGYGVAVATGNNAVISRSVISGNGIAGIEADPGATVIVDNTEITHNASYGIYALGTVSLANSDISFNTSSIFGATTSYGNNRLLGNGGGTAPTPAGGASTDFGQQ